MKAGLIAFALFYTWPLSAQIMSASDPDSMKISKCLQGKWKLSNDANETLLIRGDSVCYFTKGEVQNAAKLRLSKEVVINNRVVDAKNGQTFFANDYGDWQEVYYLLSFSDKEFSIMAYANARTSVYKRAK